MATTNEIIEALREFSTKIDETIVNGKREGLLRPSEEVYTRHPIDERSIEQTDYGVKRRNYATEEFVKESWFLATRIERRISDAVIGLECLFLMENDELSFRLRLRVAKLLGMIGFDSYHIQDAIRRAYEVRSAFLHGDQVEARKLRKIGEQYGSLNNLLLEVLDHLRSAIVLLTLIKATKAEFIELIDSSFIDENASQKLAEILTPVRTLFLLPERAARGNAQIPAG